MGIIMAILAHGTSERGPKLTLGVIAIALGLTGALLS